MPLPLQMPLTASSLSVGSVRGRLPPRDWAVASPGQFWTEGGAGERACPLSSRACLGRLTSFS